MSDNILAQLPENDPARQKGTGLPYMAIWFSGDPCDTVDPAPFETKMFLQSKAATDWIKICIAGSAHESSNSGFGALVDVVNDSYYPFTSQKHPDVRRVDYMIRRFLERQGKDPRGPIDRGSKVKGSVPWVNPRVQNQDPRNLPGGKI